MAVIRNILATLLFALGFFTFAGGCVVSLASMAAEAYNHQPITWDAFLPGAIVAGIGVIFLLLARALDGKNGPVKRYNSKSTGRGDYR